MNKSKFIGKQINPNVEIDKSTEELQLEESEFYDLYGSLAGEPTDLEPQFSVLQIYLEDYDAADYQHTQFSIQILLVRNRIKDIRRIAHFHMGGGEGVDDQLRLFPTRRLEAEATQILLELTIV